MLKLCFDGACDNRANPPYMGIGVAVYYDRVRMRKLDHSELIGVGTNNIAEYRALITALKIAKKELLKYPTIEHIVICGDSQLIIYQVQGMWSCKNEYLQPLCLEAKQLVKETGAYLKWFGREFNKEADILSKKCLEGLR